MRDHLRAPLQCRHITKNAQRKLDIDQIMGRHDSVNLKELSRELNGLTQVS